MGQRLIGQVALVTGGGRGIGRAVAVQYAAEGAAVAITSRTQSQVDETVQIVRDAGGTAIGVAGDVSSPEDVARTISRVESELGPISVLLANAGITGPYGPIWEVDAEQWWYTEETHLRGAFLYINQLVPGMIERGGGHVLTMVSGAGLRPVPYFSGYGVAKAAQIRLMEILGIEAKAHNVFAFAVSPGLVYTELAESTINDPGAQKWLPQFVERLKQAREAGEQDQGLAVVSELCVRLACGDADVATGQHFSPEDNLDDRIEKAKQSA
jgi:NAD(P)-dependent dehydrogenase (short-subunit alcohol dehydrogenase family)